VGGNTLHPGEIRHPCFTVFDQSGNFLELLEYDLGEDAWLGRQAKQTPDGGFVLCGETTSTGYVDGFLLKTSTEGEVERLRPDGGFVSCGETTSTGEVDGLLVKTRPEGELEWVRTYGARALRAFVITADLAPEGGCYVGGKRELTFNSFDPWVRRVDGLGEV